MPRRLDPAFTRLVERSSYGPLVRTFDQREEATQASGRTGWPIGPGLQATSQ